MRCSIRFGNMFHYKFIHIIWCFLFYLSPLTLYGQRTISGRITDADDGAPVPGVHVFIANTTVGTTTNADGYYQLKIPGEGSYQIAVSHVGYQPVFMEIEPGKASKVVDIELQIYEMEGVEVALKIKARKQDITLFWRTILGENPSMKTIHAINSEAPYFYYNSKTEKLTVTCRTPLHIINHEMGYHIQYELNVFSHDYKTNISSWKAQCLFSELEPENDTQKRMWEEKRKQVYQVSIVHFIKTLYHNHSLWENGFLLIYPKYKPDYLISPDDYLSIDPVTQAKTFFIPEDVLDPNDPYDVPIMLICFGQPITYNDLQDIKYVKTVSRRWHEVGLFRSRLIMTEPVHIFPDGTSKNPILWIPMYSSSPLSGLNMTPPFDYDPDIVSDYIPDIIK